jgi:hypothetical protein
VLKPGSIGQGPYGTAPRIRRRGETSGAEEFLEGAVEADLKVFAKASVMREMRVQSAATGFSEGEAGGWGVTVPELSLWAHWPQWSAVETMR